MRESEWIGLAAAPGGAGEGQMNEQFRAVRKFLSDRRGVTALEYGIVACALTFVFVICFAKLGVDLGVLMGSVSSSL